MTTQPIFSQGKSNVGGLLPAISQKGRPSKKLSLMEDFHFLSLILRKRGWSKEKLDKLIALNYEIKWDPDERLRFCHRFLSTRSNVRLQGGRGPRARDVISELRRRQEFAAESAATSWPVVELVLSFPNTHEGLNNRIAKSLDALKLTRLPAKQFARGLEAMVAVGMLPPSTNVIGLANWHHDSGIVGVLKSKLFVLRRLEVSICLFVEAVLCGRADVAQKWQDCAEGLMSSVEFRRTLDSSYRELFCQEVRSRIFRTLLIASLGQRTRFKSSYVGAPLISVPYASDMLRTLRFVTGLRRGSFAANSPVPGDEIYPGYAGSVYRETLFVPWPMTCDELAALDRLSKAEGRSQSEIMSRALMLYEMVGDQYMFEEFELERQNRSQRKA